MNNYEKKKTSIAKYLGVLLVAILIILGLLIATLVVYYSRNLLITRTYLLFCKGEVVNYYEIDDREIIYTVKNEINSKTFYISFFLNNKILANNEVYITHINNYYLRTEVIDNNYSGHGSWISNKSLNSFYNLKIKSVNYAIAHIDQIDSVCKDLPVSPEFACFKDSTSTCHLSKIEFSKKDSTLLFFRNEVPSIYRNIK